MTAIEDWEATRIIFEDQKTSSIVDNEGNLIRGTIELPVSLKEVVFCRITVSGQEPVYRFWTLDVNEMQFCISFWANPSTGDYAKVEVTLLSEYPTSFAEGRRDEWVLYLNRSALCLLKDSEVSFSVCDFVQHQALDFFDCIYQNETLRLICFDDPGPTFYDTTTIETKPNKPFPFVRQMPNGLKETAYQMTQEEGERIHPVLLHWGKWMPRECPICFEIETDLATVTCGHAFCRTCLTHYLRMKAEEIQQHKNNPFLCPVTDCRRGMLIIGCVKPFLPADLMENVRTWYKDKKNPPCWSLPDCINKAGCDGRLRKKAIDSYIVFCDQCDGHWCELCLKRVRDNEHDDSICDVQASVNFCERYLAASDEAKQKCEARWPWIKLYAHSRVHDFAATQWIESHGQLCPGCKTGIERSEGCFHMKCQCGTHFCYECGAEIFPPYYGTHHCWENVM